jgi:hypothetical protein
MVSYPFNDFVIVIDREGSKEFFQVRFPVRYGVFSEIKNPEYVFQMNLTG